MDLLGLEWLNFQNLDELSILMGVLGVSIGLSVLLGKKKIRTGYFQIFGLLIIGITIELTVVW